MIRSLYFDNQGQKKTDLSRPEMEQALKRPDGLLWISLEQPTEAEAQAILHDLFRFHPLAIEDCLNSGYQTPKVDDYGAYIFIIAHAVRKKASYIELETMELNFFLGENFLVTLFLDDNMPPVEAVLQRIDRDDRLTRNGSDFLCYSIMDKLVDDYLPILDSLDDEIEWLEDRVLEKPQPQILERILIIKHALMYLRRIMSPQRELVNRLTRDHFPMIDRHSQVYFRDVYDHLVRYHDLVEMLRDIVSSSMDIYLNSTSLRLNEVMKALTVVSTIFLPLSFVAGVYGMNFEFMPELAWPLGYPMVWAVFVLIVVGMLTYFKRQGWF
jgi:magnesium transporter